jgi:hypothetical protein
LAAFAPTLIKPTVLAGLLARLPATVFGNPKARIELNIDIRDDALTPKLYFTVGLTTVAYTLDGRLV